MANRLAVTRLDAPDLGVDVLDVVARRLRRDHQTRRDLLARQPAREQTQHVHLAGREPGRSLAPPADPVAGGDEHGVDRVGVEPSGLDLGAQLTRRPPRQIRAGRYGRGSRIDW